jgi:biopolymer transport protein ExbB
MLATLLLATAWAYCADAQPEPTANKPAASQPEARSRPRPASRPASQPDDESSFDAAATSVVRRLRASEAELRALEEQIEREFVPLTRTLNDLERQLLQVRDEYQNKSSLRDRRKLDLANLKSDIAKRRKEATYLSNLLEQYRGDFESTLHIAEIQRYREPLEAAKLARESDSLSECQVYATQAALVAVSLERLHDALGGARFQGTAANAEGLMKAGTFVLVGPAALFRSADGQDVGMVSQRLGSAEPTVTSFSDPADAQSAKAVIADARGAFPLDPTLGDAQVIEATEDTLLEHIKKGGPVMVPIFALAGVALLVALYKWVFLAFVRKPSRRRIDALLRAVARRDRQAALGAARRVGGPTGGMLAVGVEHIDEPRELIEEVMYERVLATRLKVQRLLPFVAISAAAAPLLGLLGTVTGIINTFKLITVFGTGDVKMLSGGISEALITTKFGLIVAIPSLLLHAFLSRKARGVVAEMEKAAAAFLNEVSKTARRGADDDA